MFRAIWKRILALFQGNKLVFQLTIQALAGEFFKRNPRFKPLVQQMFSDTVMTIMGDALSMAEARKSIVVRINTLGSSPAEKALLTTLVDSLFEEMNAYVTKEKIVNVSDQTQVVVQVLRWIIEASKF
jgi:hypothetical protein